MKRRSARCTALGMAIACAGPLLGPRHLLAQGSAYSLRTAAGLALMLSRDQRGPLGYEGGAHGTIAVSRTMHPLLSLQLSLRGGGFIVPAAKHEGNDGGFLGGLFGLRLHSAPGEVVPYLAAELGVVVTGSLWRPWLSASAGLDIQTTDAIALGPVLGLDDVIQWNSKGHSTDAVFLWVGLALRYHKPAPAPPRRPRPRPQAPVEVPLEPSEPSHDDALEVLMEHTFAPTRIELLAPVLFAFDSAALQPIGIAMLHEVKHTLETRPDIRLLEVQGYADERGDVEYNRALSQRRAEAVQSWLVEHGIAPERLRVAAHGAELPVEQAADEAAYTQNRRVVFRVVEVEEASP